MRFPLADADWSWRVVDPVTVGVACIQAGDHARYWVNVADPTHVIAFQADDLDGIARLGQAFGRSWLTSTIQGHGPFVSGNDPAIQPPALTGPQARQAVVAAVTQWAPTHLDESTLMIDEALALSDAGHDAAAVQLLELVASTVLDLAGVAHAGLIPVVAHASIRRAAALLRTADGLEDWVRDQLFQVDEAVWPAPAPSDHEQSDDPIDTSPADVPVVVDPRYLHARVLTWSQRTGHADATWAGNTIEVRGVLPDHVAEDSREVHALRARLVDLSTESVLATVPFTVDDVGIATAILPAASDRGEKVVWVFSEGVGAAPQPTRAAADRANEEMNKLRQFVIDRAVAAAMAVNTGSAPAGDPGAPLLAELVALDTAGLVDEFPQLVAELDDVDLVAWQWQGALDIAAAFQRDASAMEEDAEGLDGSRQCATGQLTVDGLEAYGYHPRVTWRYCHGSPLTVFVAPVDDVPEHPLPVLEASWGTQWAQLREDDEGNYTVSLPDGDPGVLRLRIVEARRE